MEKLADQRSALPPGTNELEFRDRLRRTHREWSAAEEGLDLESPGAQETHPLPQEEPATDTKTYTEQYAMYLERMREQARRTREVLATERHRLEYEARLRQAERDHAGREATRTATPTPGAVPPQASTQEGTDPWMQWMQDDGKQPRPRTSTTTSTTASTATLANPAVSQEPPTPPGGEDGDTLHLMQHQPLPAAPSPREELPGSSVPTQREPESVSTRYRAWMANAIREEEEYQRLGTPPREALTPWGR